MTFPLHTVTFPWLPTNCTRSNNKKHTSQLEVSFWVLLLFYPWELFIACSKCQKMQDFFLVRSIRSDSLLMWKLNPSGVFVDAFILKSQFILQFSIFSCSRIYLTLNEPMMMRPCKGKISKETKQFIRLRISESWRRIKETMKKSVREIHKTIR